MTQSIGDTAGKVWEFLHEKGETKLSQLKKGVKADSNLVLQAIGWLAREDKLLIRKTGRYITYALKE
ncbi:MAG: winged helix-turn-helix domain-containing protein [Syntrophaceae bacterium]|nr:winged helix-turn-helix domain-containing protein [Syntrophaceae bacterium]